MSIIDEIIKMNEELKNMNLSPDKVSTALQKNQWPINAEEIIRQLK